VASRITVSGPLWDGEASAAVTAWLDDTKRELAASGQELLRAFPMDKSGRATGAHVSSITTLTQSSAELVQAKSTKGKVWWPWLEGTSHRNATTRWKGYGAVRKTRLKMRREANKVAQARLDAYIGRMGGGA